MKHLIRIMIMFFGITNIVFAQTKNLGSNVNSKFHEVRPLVTEDGKKLFFTREGGPQNKFKDGQDIWVSIKDSTGEWGTSERLPNIVNRDRYNSVYWTNEDGTVLLIRGSYDEKTKEMRRGFSITRMSDKGWTTPTPIDIKDYEELSRGIYTGASLTKDEKVLFMYFTSETNGETNDLWVSFYNDTVAQYSRPQKLDISEDEFDEISPFIASDGKTLYFSSDKDGGLGSHDIWVSKRLDNTWLNWSKPTNLGKPFNSKDWDSYFSIGENDSIGFFSTNNKHSMPSSMGGADIISSVLPEILRPEKPIIKKISDFVDANGDGVDDNDGTIVIRDTIYITIIKKDSTVEQKVIPCNPYDTMSIAQLEKELTKGRIMFDYGSSTLRSDAFRKLDVLIAILNKNGNMKIEIAGHSDSKGTEKGNMKQSVERAESAKGYLTAKGIDEKRLKIKGYGEKKPVATNETDEGRQLNRRVDIYVIEE